MTVETTSLRLPQVKNASDLAPMEAFGFVFGEQVEGDDLFWHVTLPEGWTSEASDHPMWSYLLDPEGNRRVAVFYKAASYDRRAFMRLERPSGIADDVCPFHGPGCVADPREGQDFDWRDDE